MKKIVGFCGITCSDCPAFIATQRNDPELKKEVAKAWSTDKEKLRPEDINCGGCFAAREALFSYCLTCVVRRCGSERGVENCAHCHEFPCVKLTVLWRSERDPVPRKTLEEMRKKLRPGRQHIRLRANMRLSVS